MNPPDTRLLFPLCVHNQPICLFGIRQRRQRLFPRTWARLAQGSRAAYRSGPDAGIGADAHIRGAGSPCPQCHGAYHRCAATGRRSATGTREHRRARVGGPCCRGPGYATVDDALRAAHVAVVIEQGIESDGLARLVRTASALPASSAFESRGKGLTLGTWSSESRLRSDSRSQRRSATNGAGGPGADMDRPPLRGAKSEIRTGVPVDI